MRLFVAGYPPAPAVRHLTRYTAGLRVVQSGVRVARPDTWHVTLAFLGEVPDERLSAVADAIDLAAQVAEPVPRLCVAGGGTFGRGRSTVLWAGLSGDVAAVVEVAGTVRRALARARLDYDRKPARPHLTLARPGERVPAGLLAEDLASLAGYRGPEWTLDQLLVVRSTLGPVPHYEPVHTAPLSPSDSGAVARGRSVSGRPAPPRSPG